MIFLAHNSMQEVIARALYCFLYVRRKFFTSLQKALDVSVERSMNISSCRCTRDNLRCHPSCWPKNMKPGLSSLKTIEKKRNILSCMQPPENETENRSSRVLHSKSQEPKHLKFLACRTKWRPQRRLRLS